MRISGIYLIHVTHFTAVPAIHSYECLEKQQLAQVKLEIVADTHQNMQKRERERERDTILQGEGAGLQAEF